VPGDFGVNGVRQTHDVTVFGQGFLNVPLRRPNSLGLGLIRVAAQGTRPFNAIRYRIFGGYAESDDGEILQILRRDLWHFSSKGEPKDERQVLIQLRGRWTTRPIRWC